MLSDSYCKYNDEYYQIEDQYALTISVASSIRLPSAPGGGVTTSVLSSPVRASAKVTISVPSWALAQSRAVASGIVARQERLPSTTRGWPETRTATAAWERRPEMRRQVASPQWTRRAFGAAIAVPGVALMARPRRKQRGRDAGLDTGRARAGATITPGYGLLLRRNMGSLT